ncbi:NucA/NucB deoxyribonuclease domain-containing protein [Streptomyces olivoreticuli]|uniref:NucA/NucB deoxyribonuclease domain-containing protein n=1 Tax=Streptomyces olivoreticuli TaxID=68246 RepID=UPI0013C2DC0E|nr:hypothetical protein [Streptomyces olivoreticuli]
MQRARWITHTLGTLGVAGLLGASVLGAPASASPYTGTTSKELVRPVVPQVTEGSNQVAPKPGSGKRAGLAAHCTPPAEGKSAACLELTEPHATAVKGNSPHSVQDIVQLPSWCLDAADGTPHAIRTQVCSLSGGTYTTSRTVNGKTTVTGEANLNIINYSYSDTSLDSWVHQIEVSAYKGWGDALKAKLSGTTTGTGACNNGKPSFPSKPIAPINSWVQGDSLFTTTATAPGAIGNCTTKWDLTFTNGEYNPTVTSLSMNDIRCDNATPGKPKVGCVVPWYPSAVQYSKSRNPTLASHVARAQASGLPGATFQAPLRRTTNETIIDENRNKACGDAPSLEGKSCDEYPLASTLQGLSSGGERRTFDDCSFDLPQQTGPVGVSVCMINDGDNRAQGGLQSQLYMRERVLDRDPFWVEVVD